MWRFAHCRGRLRAILRGVLATVHVLDFRSLRHMIRWRLAARKRLDGAPGLRFHRVMSCFGTRASAGFSIAGPPDLRRAVVLLVWESDAAGDAFLERSPLVRGEARCAWHVRAQPIAARGSHRGESPFAGIERSAAGARSSAEGQVAVLTLGRTRLRKMLSFARISPRADRFLATDGLAFAVSAGLPVFGNCTFTVWQSEEAMLRFAYGAAPGDHRETLRRNRADGVLVEQLSARFEPLVVDGSSVRKPSSPRTQARRRAPARRGPRTPECDGLQP